MYPEALTETGARLFPNLSRFSNYCLVGGTALALQIGHRVSVDFDMFTDEELPRLLLAKVKRVFTGSVVYPSINNSEQLNVSIDGVKATFFCYPYPPILPLVEYRGVKMVSVAEIAAMKAFAIGQRGTYRDYVDMFFLLAEKHITLNATIELADKKFGEEFNHRLFLEQLTYLDDIRRVEVEFLRNPVTREQVQKGLEDMVAAVPDFKLQD